MGVGCQLQGGAAMNLSDQDSALSDFEPDVRLPLSASDMDANLVHNAIARKMIDEWINPTADQHTASMERLAVVSYHATLAFMESADKTGVAFRYDS